MSDKEDLLTIKTLLEKHPDGLKASEMSIILRMERKQVNHIVYGHPNHFVRDGEYIWKSLGRPISNTVVRNNSNVSQSNTNEAYGKNFARIPYDKFLEYTHDLRNEANEKRWENCDFKEDNLRVIRKQLLKTYRDTYITMDNFKDMLIKYDIPGDYHRSLAIYVAGLNNDLYNIRMIDDYKSKYRNDSVEKEDKHEEVVINPYKPLKMTCPYDANVLTYVGIRDNIPAYRCDFCRHQYTSLSGLKDMDKITSGEDEYINLNVEEVSEEKRPSVVINPYSFNSDDLKKYYSPRTCYCYLKKQPTVCRDDNCKTELIDGCFMAKTFKGETVHKDIKACPMCGTLYIPSDLFAENKALFDCKNIIEFENWVNINPDKLNRKIAFRDFIVRTNSFKCNKHHHIDNIEAIVTLLSSSGKLFEVSVPAGYCKNCDVYFITEQTFLYLKRRGMIACRVTDEKTYSVYGKAMDGGLAKESLLKQFGYTVSAQTGLSSDTRQRILGLIIDNGILSQSVVMGYLEFFINQHSKQRTEKYDLAISKWKEDYKYIINYHPKTPRKKIRVGGIIR